MGKFLAKCMMTAAVMFMIVGCGTSWKARHQKNTETETEIVFGGMYGYNYRYDNRQVDSMCHADGIPRDLSKWNISAYRDYETNGGVVIYRYIKEYSAHREMIYLLTPVNGGYKLMKRMVINE